MEWFLCGVFVGLVGTILLREIREVVRLAQAGMNSNPTAPRRKGGRFGGTPKSTTRRPAAPQPPAWRGGCCRRPTEAPD